MPRLLCGTPLLGPQTLTFPMAQRLRHGMRQHILRILSGGVEQQAVVLALRGIVTITHQIAGYVVMSSVAHSGNLQ